MYSRIIKIVDEINFTFSTKPVCTTVTPSLKVGFGCLSYGDFSQLFSFMIIKISLAFFLPIASYYTDVLGIRVAWKMRMGQDLLKKLDVTGRNH
jgi:hypothetical protein